MLAGLVHHLDLVRLCFYLWRLSDIRAPQLDVHLLEGIQLTICASCLLDRRVQVSVEISIGSALIRLRFSLAKVQFPYLLTISEHLFTVEVCWLIMMDEAEWLDRLLRGL